MSLGDLHSQQNEMIEVQCSERWSIYRRLQELEIPCSCSYSQPLKVQIGSTMIAIQLWGVSRQVNAARTILVEHLEQCWHIYKINEN